MSLSKVNRETKSLPLLKDPKTTSLVKRLVMGYAKPYLGHMVLGGICMILVAATTALLAKQMQPIIDEIFFEKKAALLYIAASQVFALFLIKGFASYGQSVIMGYVGQRIIATLQTELFAKVIRCDFSFLQKVNSGQLVSRFVLDMPKLDNVITKNVTSIIKDTLTVIFLVSVMVYQDWMLSLIAVVAFPVAILPVSRIGKRMRKTSGDIQSGWANLTTLVTQAIQGIRLIKAYNLETHENKRASETVHRVFKLTLKGIRTKSIVHPVMEMLGGFAIVIVIIYGGARVINGGQSAGAFFSFITALIMAYEPMKNLAKLNTNLQEALAAVARVFEIMDRQQEVVECESPKEIVVKEGAITFKEVSFSYQEGAPVLKRINLCLQPGQKVALVGPSGAGKSTLLNLIPRFYDPTAGAILLDDQPICEVTFTSLRRSMALVSQEVVLFDDTVRNNILFGQLDATEDQVIQAAQDAAAHDFISQLEHGYDTVIGEHGVKLSGGQRQRLSIARAMLRNAPILLLDEATSSLDSESEMRIQQALKKLMKGRTTLTIAHRLSTVIDADVICVMEKGEIVASGSHEYLLQTSPLYQTLFKAQFADKELAA